MAGIELVSRFSDPFEVVVGEEKIDLIQRNLELIREFEVEKEEKEKPK